MEFTKMHGAGNDFVVINLIDEDIPPEKLGELAKTLCARRTGVGADGMMFVARAKGDADFKLLFYNSDGSLGEMCGNGARCIARYGYEHGLSGNLQRIETTAGIVTGERIDESLYRIRLNDPTVLELDRIAEDVSCSYVELGDPGIPHAVCIMDDWDLMPTDELKRLGQKLRYSSAFKKGANVSFVKIVGRDEVKAVTYERGVEDFTLACGTGSGSIVSVMTAKGLVSGENVKVSMPGGDLYITLKNENGMITDIYLTGPTCVVYTAELTEY